MIGKFLELLTCLSDYEVDLVIIGGFASAAHMNRPRDRQTIIELKALSEKRNGK